VVLEPGKRRGTFKSFVTPAGEPEWVFPSPMGLLYDERNFANAWRRVRARAQKAGVRPLKFHCTRHTFITWALEAGRPAKRVSEWVGASVAVLEKHYAHVLPQGEDDLSFVVGEERQAPAVAVDSQPRAAAGAEESDR
jgi:integrase